MGLGRDGRAEVLALKTSLRSANRASVPPADAAPPPPVRVVTVIPSWNRRHDTLACLASLARLATPGLTHGIVLVDNASTDGTVAAVRGAWPRLQIVALTRNVGFAAAVNRGLDWALAAAADWVLVLNNDTVLDPRLLVTLVAAGEADPTVGLVTPTVYYFDRPAEVWPSAGWRRGLTLAAFDTTAAPPTQAPYEVDWATGCCLLVRRAVWDTVGRLDERYHFYYEDHDFCLRTRAAGWRILHVPRARAWHRVSASTGQGTPLQMYLLGRASVAFFARYGRGPQALWLAPYRAGSLARTLATTAFRGRPEAGLAYARGVWTGMMDVMAGEGGDTA